MPTTYDYEAGELISRAAEELKNFSSIKMPDWAKFVKTGRHAERPPDNPDWWFIRAAALLRKIYTKGPIGISKLRVLYGGKKNRGVKREHFYRAGGKIIRVILQQLENEGLVRKVDLKQGKPGRIITPKGMKFLDTVMKNK